MLYDFGHGLSYSSFTYSNLEAADELAAPVDDRQRTQHHHHHGKALLHVTVDITNVGSMAADEVSLLLLSFQQPQREHGEQAVPQWRRWWRWLLATAGGDPAAAPKPATIRMPCTKWVAGGGSRDQPSSQPAALPTQTLAGFERVTLRPGDTASVRFTLTAATFTPFSPAPAAFGTNEGDGSGEAMPYCGDYELRVGGEQLVVTLAHDGAAASA